MKRIGPLFIVEGPNNSKVPYSRNVYIDCSEKVLIDAGAEPKALLEIHKQFGVELILNTHYHPDHTRFNHLFPSAQKWINPIEFETARTIDGVAKVNGVYEENGENGIEKWKKSIPVEWIGSLEEISGSYEYEVDYTFGDVKVTFLHTPGHTRGFASPYFPNLGIVYVGDYDMTSFGPWYNGTDGDIEDFIESGRRLLYLDAQTYITAHQKGIFTKQEFQQELEKFLEIIDKRDNMIADYVNQGLTFEELTDIGIFYPKDTLNVPMFKIWERSGIKKHLRRLNLTVAEADKTLVAKK